MVMPRSRSIGLVSSTCASISRSVSPPQIWMMRSASVDLPWSTWAMMEKLRMSCIRRERGIIACRSASARDRPADPWPKTPLSRAGALLQSRLFLRNRDRHEPAGAIARNQQQYRVAGLDVGGRGLELGHAVHRTVAHAQNHVARLQAGLRGRAGNIADHHAATVLQAQLLAHGRRDRLHGQAKRAAGPLGRSRGSGGAVLV